MASALSTFDDVADLWPEVDQDQFDRITRLIDKASGLLRRALPAVDRRIELYGENVEDPMALDPSVVATVVATVVKRFLNNPTGALNHSITEGPYAESIGYGERIGGKYVQRGTLVVTEADLEQLLPASGINVGSMRVGFYRDRARRW